jgi:hypothetical protein
MAKKIFIRITALTLIIAILDVLYNATLFRKDLWDMCDQAVELREKQDSTNIFYLAESSNFNFRENDSTKRSIAEITSQFFPGLRLVQLNKSATHAGIYRQWITAMDLNKKKPDALVVTLNLRSFNAAWINSIAESSLQQSTILLKPYPDIVNRFLLSLNTFDDKTPKQREKLMLNYWKNTKLIFPYDFKYKTVREWDDAMAHGGHLNSDGTWNVDKSILACHYIKAYAFNLDENNPRIKDFDFISGWCHRQGIKLYLNLMAENVRYADSLVGKQLVYLMRINRDYLVKRYSSADCEVVDNMELVPGLEFTDQNWTTEHYGCKGRMIIAKHLAEALRKQFPAQYKAAY